MDITLLSPNSLKLKIQKTSIVFNPEEKTPKTEADAVLANEPAVLDRVKDYRVFINSSGDYEVGGLKISSAKFEDSVIFSFNLNGKDAVLGNATGFAKIPQDKIRDYAIAIINVDGPIPENVITAMEPRAIVVYGENAEAAAKSLGENINKTSKATISEDKLPEETEVFLLS